MKAFGTRPTYRIFSVMTLITGFIYLLFNVFYLSKRPQIEGNDIVKKKPKNVDKEKNNETVKSFDDNSIKSQKEKEADESRVPYVIDDIEAINNARNLDIIESINEEEEKEERKKKIENELGHRHVNNGTVNAAYATDEDDGCTVTVENEPRIKDDDNLRL